MTEFEATPHATPLVRTIEELAASRGIPGLEAVVTRANEAGHQITAAELRGKGGRQPRCGSGRKLDTVLGLSEEERIILSRAFADTFWRGSR